MLAGFLLLQSPAAKKVPLCAVCSKSKQIVRGKPNESWSRCTNDQLHSVCEGMQHEGLNALQFGAEDGVSKLPKRGLLFNWVLLSYWSDWRRLALASQ